MKKITLLGAAIVFFDQLTKLLVRGLMAIGESIKILPFLRITYVENTGMAWGLLATEYSNYLFAFLNFSALIFLLINYKKFGNTKTSAIAWTLIVAGAIGNLGDRIFLGAVVDFIDVGFKIGGKDYKWPVFNVADSAISIGGVVLFYSLLKSAAFKPERVRSDSNS